MKNITDFEGILKEKYREKGTSARDMYDVGSLAFRLGSENRDKNKLYLKNRKRAK